MGQWQTLAQADRRRLTRPNLTFKIVWTPEAADNLDAIVAYIELFHPPAAERMAARLIALADSLADFPERGRDAGEGRREMTIVPPYILRYRVEAERVIILRIRHGAREVDE